MRAYVFRRPRKSLTSPDAEKTSAATQRPGEELRNWQVPYCVTPFGVAITDKPALTIDCISHPALKEP